MSTSKKPTLIQSIVGMAVIVTVILFILFSGASAITDDNIKQHLDRFADYVSDKSAEGMGKTGKFTYGDIVVSGFGFNKSAVVNNVILELSEKSPIDTPKWSFSTSRIQVLPDPVVPGRLYFVFPEPINIIENSQLKTTVTSSTPIKYAFTDDHKDGTPLFTHAVHLPNQIIFTPGQAAGDSNPHINRTMINLGDNGKLTEDFAPEQGIRNAEVALNGIKITTDSGSETSIGGINATYTENTVGNQVKGQYIWTISDISGPSLEAKNNKPVSISGDIGFKGDKLAVKLQDLGPSFGNTDFTINKLSLSTDDFKLLAQGWMGFATDDPLPFGSLDLSLDNAGKFVASYLVPGLAKGTLTAALQKMSTQPVGDETHVDIPLKRDKNGVLFIGDTTFESLTASLAADALKLPPRVLPPDAAQPPASPVFPPADNPAPDQPDAAAPAPVPAPEPDMKAPDAAAPASPEAAAPAAPPVASPEKAAEPALAPLEPGMAAPLAKEPPAAASDKKK